MLELNFDTWKAEYEPKIYEDSGAECYDHEECECEFLYTYDLAELDFYDELAPAIIENRVWTWHGDGRIVSGIDNPRADILVTAKPYEQETIVR
jgi:hypothetical protein